MLEVFALQYNLVLIEFSTLGFSFLYSLDYVAHRTLIFENQKKKKIKCQEKRAKQYKMIVWFIVQTNLITKSVRGNSCIQIDVLD